MSILLEKNEEVELTDRSGNRKVHLPKKEEKYLVLMCGSCHFDRVPNDEFSVDCFDFFSQHENQI